jgi:hypothetical protein
MVLSDNETDDAIGALRLGFVVLLAPVWLLGGIALVWFGETLFGIGSIVIGLIMIGGGYRLYRAIARPDVVRDERVEEAQYRQGLTHSGQWYSYRHCMSRSVCSFLKRSPIRLHNGEDSNLRGPLASFAGL